MTDNDKNKSRTAIWAWAFYDWANSTFSTTVMAGFFPLFFKEYWSAGLPATESTFQLGLANSLASIVIVLLAPALGAIADRGGTRKQFLFAFMIMGAICTGGLYAVEQGNWPMASLFFILSSIGFGASLIFYDALLLNVAREEEYDKVSAFGFALGYLGGGLLFALNVAMTLVPDFFGFANVAEAVRFSFLTVAIWWFLFTLPLMFKVYEPPVAHGRESVVRSGLRQLIDTFHHIRSLRNVFLFLIAYWFYIDGVNTVISMAVDYGLALGFSSASLITALLITQFVGFPAAIIYGHLGAKYGPKAAIYVGIAVYVAVVAWGARMESEKEFYALAIIIGLVQGGVQSLSRSLYARLVPPDKSAEFFGFFNVMGKFATILGPMLVGWTALATGDSRLSLLSLLILFAIGAWFLRDVRLEHTKEE